MAEDKKKKQKQGYELFKIGMKTKDIAAKLGVSDATVRTWKKRYKWELPESTVYQDEGAVVRKRNKPEEHEKMEIAAGLVEEVMSNDLTSDKQQLFLLLLVKCFNATTAYSKAFGCENRVRAASEASKLLARPEIRAEYNRLKRMRYMREYLDAEDIFQKHMDIAFADITDYLDFGTRTERDQKTGKEYDYSYVRLKDSKKVDGTLVTEVKQGRDGVSIKLMDRQKSLDWLKDQMSILTEKEKLQNDIMRKKLKEGDNGDKPIQIELIRASEKQGDK